MSKPEITLDKLIGYYEEALGFDGATQLITRARAKVGLGHKDRFTVR